MSRTPRPASRIRARSVLGSVPRVSWQTGSGVSKKCPKSVPGVVGTPFRHSGTLSGHFLDTLETGSWKAPQKLRRTLRRTPPFSGTLPKTLRARRARETPVLVGEFSKHTKHIRISNKDTKTDETQHKKNKILTETQTKLGATNSWTIIFSQSLFSGGPTKATRRNTIPPDQKLLFILLMGFKLPNPRKKGGLFQGIMREKRNFRKSNYFRVLETFLASALYRKFQKIMRLLMTFLGKINRNPS